MRVFHQRALLFFGHRVGRFRCGRRAGPHFDTNLRVDAVEVVERGLEVLALAQVLIVGVRVELK